MWSVVVTRPQCSILLSSSSPLPFKWAVHEASSIDLELDDLPLEFTDGGWSSSELANVDFGLFFRIKVGAGECEQSG